MTNQLSRKQSLKYSPTKILVTFFPVALFLLMTSQTCLAQQWEVSDPSSAGIDSEELTKFEQMIDDEIEAERIAGCSALLFKDGKVLMAKNWGHQDREKEIPVADDTIWRIYSMSKPITSVAVMQLVEAGKLKLDDPVATYLPEFKDLKVLDGDSLEPENLVDCEREMTVRDLLRHTSGLTYGFFGNSPVDQEYKKQRVLVMDKDLQETVTKLGSIPLLHQPGARWHYSVSTDVLGRVVEVVSEKSFADYLDENIFTPLDMSDTFFIVPKEKRDRFAKMYSPARGGKLKPASALTSYRFLNDHKLYSGGGGLCSTVHDYLQFCKMLLGEGESNGQKILKHESVAEMFKNQLPKSAASRRFQFGLGFSISAEGHCSWGGAAGTRFWVDPENQIAGIFMIQINPYRAKEYGNQLKERVYKAFE